MSVGYGPSDPQTTYYFFSKSDFIIPNLILTPLSLFPSCRQPLSLQEGPVPSLPTLHLSRRPSSVSTLFKSNDGRISAVCDDQYSSTLAMLKGTADEAFKVYMTRKTQGWFRRWGCPRLSDAAASPGPGVAPCGAGSGAGAMTPLSRQCVARHHQRQTTRKVV
jgi:hypothetical protein